jgi:hypothetical protein
MANVHRGIPKLRVPSSQVASDTRPTAPEPPRASPKPHLEGLLSLLPKKRKKSTRPPPGAMLPLLSAADQTPKWSDSQPVAMLNGEVTVRSAEHRPPRKVVCRHLAELSSQTPVPSEFFAKVGNAEAIEEVFSGPALDQVQADWDHHVLYAPESSQRRMVLSSKLGLYLRDVGAQLRVLPRSAEPVVISMGHAYRINMHWQSPQDGAPPRLLVSCYDPNLTTREFSFFVHNEEELQEFDLVKLCNLSGMAVGSPWLREPKFSMTASCLGVDLSAIDHERHAGRAAQLPLRLLTQQTLRAMEGGMDIRLAELHGPIANGRFSPKEFVDDWLAWTKGSLFTASAILNRPERLLLIFP